MYPSEQYLNVYLVSSSSDTSDSRLQVHKLHLGAADVLTAFTD